MRYLRQRSRLPCNATMPVFLNNKKIVSIKHYLILPVIIIMRSLDSKLLAYIMKHNNTNNHTNSNHTNTLVHTRA